MSNSTTTNPQFSVWLTEKHNSAQYKRTFDSTSQITSGSNSNQSLNHEKFTDLTDSKRRRYRIPGYTKSGCPSLYSCLRGLLLGALVSAIGLAIVLPLWLISTKTTTTLYTEKTTTTSTTGTTVTTTTVTTITTTTTVSTTTSTSTTTTTTTTTIFCGFVNTGLLQSYRMNAPTTWTQYTYAYTATSNRTIIRFSSATDNPNKDWYVDDVSIGTNGNPSMNLIVNGDFESGPSVGWQMYSCSSACTATIEPSSNCHGGVGQCYHNLCSPSSNIQFLEQSFNSRIGVTYNISFWIVKGGSGVGPGMDLYANVVF